MLESFYNQLDPDTIASVQLLMTVQAASSETVRLSCQELIKELVGGKKMKVSDLVKKLTVIAKFNEADDHLNAHAQRTGGGIRKRQLDSIVSVNAVHDNSGVKKCNRCGIDFVPDKATYKWCNNCHRSKFQGKLELTDGALQKFNEKKRHKQKKSFAKEKAGKSKKNPIQSHKKISANVVEAASDSEDDQPVTSVGSDSEEEERKSKKRMKKTPKDEAHAKCVDILNTMNPKARKKLCKYYISSESAEMFADMDASTTPVSSWHFNRLESPFVDGMTVGFANEQLDNSDALEQLKDQVVTEEILTSELPIQNIAIPNMQIQIPATDFGLLVDPASWIQLFDNTEGAHNIRQQAEMELESILQGNLDLMYESEQTLEQEHADIVEPARALPLNFPLMIEAALAGTTTSAGSKEAKRVLSKAGDQAVDSTIATSPLTYGAAQHVLNRFASGHKTSAELLAQAINAFAAYARIPKQLIMAIPAHWMLADSGATMHLLLDLVLAFADVETHRIVRGFNGSESHCIRASQLVFCALVTCRGRQIRKSITSGVVDAFVTPDLNRSIFSVARVVEQGHRAHFGGDSPGLILKAAENAGVTSNFIPFVRGDNMDGAAGLKYFVPTIPMLRTANMSFDINLEPQAHGILAADEPEEVD